MTFETLLYVAYSCAAVFISIITSYMFWNRRKTTSALSLSLLMLLAAEWSLADLLSALSINPAMKITWNSIAYFGIAFVPVTWFLFSLQYTRQDKHLTTKSILGLCLVPTSTVVFALTNSGHHLFKLSTSFESLGPGSLTVVVSKYGPGFYVHTVYSYFLIMLGTIILLGKLVRLPRVYRNQAIIMTLAVLAPLVGNILYIAGLSPSKLIDMTAFSFTISGLLCFWGVFHYKLVDLIPAAREAIIENMEDIIIVLDTQDRIIDINTSGKNMFNINTTNIIGQPISVILGEHYTSFKKYDPMKKVNEKISIEYGGEKKYIDFRIFPLYDSKGRFNGRFIIMRDVTLLEKTIIELKDSRKVAIEASKAKSQFLANMSHEIRTPLNGIIGMAELLSSANLNDEEAKYLQAIGYSTNSLLYIINEILDFSKIESGKMELEKTCFNIYELVDSIVKFFLHKKNQQNLNLVCEIDKTIPQNIAGDPTKLRQILSNLLSNAFKFTEYGDIKVEVKKITDDDKHVLLGFSVSDTGIGIPVDKIQTLFESFHQLDSSTTRKYGGTGLGLAIVKSLIDLMGGSITVESEVGKGSIFSFQIPFVKPELPFIPIESVEQENTSLNKMLRVLLAEDNKVNQMFMVNLLSKKNWMIDIADTGKKVLEKMEVNKYDLILMDIQMPEMDGIEAAIKIREKEQTSGGHIPIIALTANATEQDKTACLQSGMDDYLSKPIKPKKLFSCISRNIN